MSTQNLSTPQQNSASTEPTMTDLLNLLKREIFFDLNCHHLATIQSFNTTKQTVTATINYTRTIFQWNSATGLYNPVQINYPLLVDMPVIVLGGGSAHLTFPISQGDQCLILFNDRNLDNWFQSGQLGPVANSRAHSFADGIALVGLNSLASSIPNYDTTNAVLRNGSAGVAVGSTLIKIFNTTTTLNTIMQDILTQLEALATAAAAITVPVTTAPGTSGVPVNAASFATIASALTTLGTQLGGLIS